MTVGHGLGMLWLGGCMKSTYPTEVRGQRGMLLFSRSHLPSSCLMLLMQNWRYEGVGNKRRGGSSRTPGIVKDDAATAFVGNLSYSATEDDVIAHLSQVARVVDARLPTTAEGACPLDLGCWIQG